MHGQAHAAEILLPCARRDAWTPVLQPTLGLCNVNAAAPSHRAAASWSARTGTRASHVTFASPTDKWPRVPLARRAVRSPLSGELACRSICQLLPQSGSRLQRWRASPHRCRSALQLMAGPLKSTAGQGSPARLTTGCPFLCALSSSLSPDAMQLRQQLHGVRQGGAQRYRMFGDDSERCVALCIIPALPLRGGTSRDDVARSLAAAAGSSSSRPRACRRSASMSRTTPTCRCVAGEALRRVVPAESPGTSTSGLAPRARAMAHRRRWCDGAARCWSWRTSSRARSRST